MQLSDARDRVRFHLPAMSCENDVELISKAICSVRAQVEFAVDRGMREVEILAAEADAVQFRAAITNAGYCITR